MNKVVVQSDGYLNSDVIFDVLSRIQVKPLLGMKCISREWHRIISSRSFIKAQLQKNDLALTGFILQEKYVCCKDDIKTVSYIPLNSTHSRVHQTVFSFLPQEVVVLASCRGIVCCRSCLPSPTHDPIIVYLCNPSNKDWIQLELPPPALCDRRESIALAFEFDFDHEQSKGSTDNISPKFKFKLVRVKHQAENSDEEDRELFFKFELYSSETRVWKKSNETCQCNNKLVKNKGIYIGGVLHWLTDGDQILTFDVENELCWMISVPVPASEFTTVPEACIGEYEGRLHYVQVSEEGLHVWCLEDYYESKWMLKHCKSLEAFEGEYPNFFLNLKNRVSSGRVSGGTSPWMNPLGFKDGVLLIKVSLYIYLYDIKNDNITQACSFLQLNPQSMSHPAVFPLSLTLLPLNN